MAIIACLILVAVLTACGSDGDDGSSVTTTTIDENTGTEGPDPDDDPTDPPEDPPIETGGTTTVPGQDPEPEPKPEPNPGPGPGPVEGPAGEPGRDLTDFEQRYVGELTGAMDDMDFPDSVDAACVSAVWVSVIGGDRLQASGLSAEDFIDFGPGDLNLDRPTAEAMHRGGLDCGLTAQALVQSMVGADGAEMECLGRALTEELFEAAMISAYMGTYDDEASMQLDDALNSCS